MTSGQKIAFSLLTAIILFSVFVLSFNSVFFKSVETRFYTQAKIQEDIEQLDKLSESCNAYIKDILTKVESSENAWVKTDAVRSYYMQNASESQAVRRRELTEELFAKIPALDGIRIIDKNGKNVHYSSFDKTDVLKQNGITKVYKNYPDIQQDAEEIEYQTLEKKFSQSQSKILFDDSANRIILCVPYYWMEGVYSGQALFYLNMAEIQKALNLNDMLSIGQTLTLFSDDDFDGGLVINIPSGQKASFKDAVLNYWTNKSKNVQNNQIPQQILEGENENIWVILSSQSNFAIKVSGVYISSSFELSREVKLLIYICIFITLFLFVYLIFSFRRDPLVVLKKKIKKIQYGIIKESMDDQNHLEWNLVAGKLKDRRNDFTVEILKSLKVHNKKKRKELEDFLDQNWNEIFSVFDSKAEQSQETKPAEVGQLSGASIEEIRKVLEEVLSNTKLNVQAVQPQPYVEDTEPVEELEDVEDAEPVEELEDFEDAEPVEELEDVEDAEPVEELEDVEDAEPVEELEDVEDAEPVEELEDVEDAEPVEELEDFEDVQNDDIQALEGMSKKQDDDSLSFLFDKPKYVYKPSNEDYFASSDFASVDNVNAEEMVIGPEIQIHNIKKDDVEEIKAYPLPENLNVEISGKSEDEENAQTFDVVEEIEELTEEIPESQLQPYYSMTGFAENLEADAPLLDAAGLSDSSIIESDGVFSISQTIDYKGVKQDLDFKALVDSVL